MWDRLPAASPGAVAAGMFAGYLVLVVPICALATRGGLLHRPVEAGAPRVAFYRRTMGGHWLLAAVAIGIAVLGRQPLSALGVRGPRAVAAGPAGLLAEAVLLIVIASAVLTLAGSKPARATQRLLPRTRDERALYAVVAVSAGLVEELLFRGFVIGYAMGGLGWSWQQASVASALAFGVGHLYQGPATAAAATMIGFGFAESYALTGSLLAPVVMHIALDLRVLAWPRARVRAQ